MHHGDQLFPNTSGFLYCRSHIQGTSLKKKKGEAKSNRIWKVFISTDVIELWERTYAKTASSPGPMSRSRVVDNRL